MKSTALYTILKALRDNKGDMIYNYTIPDLWNLFDYGENHYIKTKTNELIINPYHFFITLIEDYILPHYKESNNYNKSISSNKEMNTDPNYNGGDWIQKQIVYSSLIRTSSAWDHDRSGTLDQSNIYQMNEMGSFIKMLALLPLLQKMGVSTLYLLPITKYSKKDKKGDLGSPYGVSNFTALDPNLKDSLTKETTTLEEEFKAFVEACHILNIRVMIDVIPRTNAVDNDLIKDHPDWFYWIQDKEYSNYKTPQIEGIPSTVQPTKELLKKVYESTETYRHINMFEYDPQTQDKALWDKIKTDNNITESIREHFGLRIAPAFSDHINDPQPPWSDITFFRMYLDHPNIAKNLLDTTKRPPYILFDTIKSNKFAGNIPNTELWKTLTDIIPSFQRRFGIDGARIDMGHALPHKLLHMIITKAREYDPDFSFIAEELSPSNAQYAKDAGYNMIIGNGFYNEPRIWDGNLKHFMYESVHLPLPVFAEGETHDTPRIASREGNIKLSRTLSILNYFMPNGVPFINSGQELYEVQPMNTGIDCNNDEQFSLNKADPFYGKLALFDKYQFHYTTKNRFELPNILEAIHSIRTSFLTEITSKDSFIPLYPTEYHPSTLIALSYHKKKQPSVKNILLILANANPYDQIYTHIDITTLRYHSKNVEMIGELLFSTHEEPRPFTQFINENILDIHLGPGEVKLVLL